jgi:hypothetical protein
MTVGGAAALTPLQLAEAAESGGPEGQALMELLEHGLRREGIDAVIRRLRPAP